MNDILEILKADSRTAFHRLRVIETTELEIKPQERSADGTWTDISEQRRAEISKRDLPAHFWFRKFVDNND